MKRKDLRNEAEHLPDSLDELVQLRERVMAIGESRRTADALCMWLVAKANAEPDTTNSNTRAKYRTILRRLDELQPVGPGGGDGGYTSLRSIAGVAVGSALGAAVAAATRDPAMALAVMAPVILDDSRYVESTGELIEVDFTPPKFAEVA